MKKFANKLKERDKFLHKSSMNHDQNEPVISRDRSKGEDLHRLIIGGEGRKGRTPAKKKQKEKKIDIDLDETQEENPEGNVKKKTKKRITFFKKKFKNDFAARKLLSTLILLKFLMVV